MNTAVYTAMRLVSNIKLFCHNPGVKRMKAQRGESDFVLPGTFLPSCQQTQSVKSFLLFYLILLSLFLLSCNNSKGPNVSAIKVEVEIKRFEQDFFEVDTNNLQTSLHALQQKYPQFFPLFTNNILRIPVIQQGQLMISVDAATAYKQILSSYRPINDSLQKKYSNLNWLHDDLVKGFQHIKNYFPQYKTPDVVTFIASFDAPGIVVTPQYLSIGLHQYAGKNFSVYKDPQLVEMYPAYISRRFDKEYIVANSLKGIADDIYADSSAGRPLIEQMIEKGKQWFLVDKFLPAIHDSLKTGFTNKQLEWLKNNEGNVWGFFTSNVDIYTIDPIIIQDYIGEAPFTRGMPEGFAPGNTGQWVGWQMIKRFEEKNDALTVAQIIATPAKTIFAEAKYRPK